MTIQYRLIAFWVFISIGRATLAQTVSITTNTPTVPAVGYFCAPDFNAAITIPITFSRTGATPAANNVYTVQITDASGNLNTFRSVPTTVVNATTLNATLSFATIDERFGPYRVRVIGSNPSVTGSPSNGFRIGRPNGPGSTGYEGPQYVSTVTICQGQASTQPLTAVPTNGASASSFVWYDQEYRPLSSAPIPNANANQTYFVSQVANGCNSIYSRINVVILTNCAPTAPTDLNANATSTTEINLNWKSANGSRTGSQQLERSSNGGSTWAKIADLGPFETTYQDKGLTPGTSYSYRVRAFENSAYSGYSNVASATTPVKTVITLISPLNSLCVGSAATAFQWKAEDDGRQAGRYNVNVYAEGATSSASPQSTAVTNTGSYGTFQFGGNMSSAEMVSYLSKMPAGRYKLAVVHTSLPTVAEFSNVYVISNPPSLNISLSDGTNTFPGKVFVGGSASIALRATNFSRWSASYKDDASGNFVPLDNTPTDQAVRWIYPNLTTVGVRNYGAGEISGFRNEGGCPNGTVSGTAQLTVKEMNLAIGNLSANAICPGQTLSAQWSINEDGQAIQGGRFVLELLRADGSLVRELSTTGGPAPDAFNNVYVVPGAANTQLRATIPDDVAEGQYKLRVAFKAPNSAYSRQSTASAGSFQVSRPAAPVVSNPPAICQGQSAPNVVSLVQANGQLRWYNESGNSVSAPTPSNTQSSKWLVAVSNGACESERRSIDVTVNAKPAAPQLTTLTDNICQGASSITLTAAGNDLTWRDNSNVESKNAPVVSTVNVATYTYRVRQTVGGCPSDETTVSVTVKPRPGAPSANAPAPVCQYVQNIPTLTATPSSGGALRWYTQATGNVGQSDQAPRPNTQTVGNQSFYVSQIVNGCESTDRTTVTQMVNAAPARPAAPPASDLLRCQAESARPVSASPASGHTLRWYDFDAGQSLPDPARGQATGFTPPATIGVRTYYVTQTDGNGCQSLQQPVSVTIVGTPGAPGVEAVQNVCQGTTRQPLTVNVQTGTTLIWSGGPISGTTTATPEPQRTTPGTEVYMVRQSIGNCVSTAVSTITFTVRPIPAAPTAQATQITCIGNTLSLSANVTAGNTPRWYTSQTDADTKNGSRPQASIPTGAALNQTWYVSQIDGNGCEGPYIPVLARVLAAPTARLVGDGTITGYDSTAIRIVLGGEGPWTLTIWNGREDKTFTRTLENPVVVWVRPPASSSATLTADYPLKALSNECGSVPAGQLPTYRITVSPVTAVEPGQAGFAMSAYPNPMNNVVHIDWVAAPRKPIVLRIVSSSGKVLWQKERTGTGSVQTESIDGSVWAAGLYVLQLQSDGDAMAEQRLMKQ